MIVVDIEATSLNFEKASILSMGAVSFDNPDKRFYAEARAYDDSDIDPKALEVAGFTVESIKDLNKPLPREILLDFINWLQQFDSQTLAGQNVHVDLKWLRAECHRSGINHKFGDRILDLHSIVYAKHLELGIQIPLYNKRSNLGLDYILQFCGVKVIRKTHNALEDALLEAECFSRIIKRKCLIDEYKKFEIPNYLLIAY